MQALRKIQSTDSDHISINIPKSFMRRSLEIIVMPIGDSNSAQESSAA